MASIILVILAATTVMTSSVLSDCPTIAADQPNIYDRACFVPPSERPSDKNQILSVNFSLPVGNAGLLHNVNTFSMRTFPNGTCGFDVYFYYPNLWLHPLLKSIIEKTEKEQNEHLYEHCSFGDEIMRSHPQHIYFKILTTGNSGYYPSVKLVPDAELSRLPPLWLNGLTCLVHFDYIVVGQHTLRCNTPLLYNPNPNTKYNANVTVQLYGCPSGTYGGLCECNCSCVEGVECHSFNGACMCPPGLQGTHCEQSDPRLTTEQQQVYIPYGMTHNLTCLAEGMIPNAYYWIKDNSSTPLKTISQQKMVTYRPRPVVITTTVEANDTSVNGGYICVVHDENGVMYRRYVNISVIAVPDPFIQAPLNHTSLTDRNVVFTCKTKEDAGRIKWVRGRNSSSIEMAEIKDMVGRYGIHYPSKGVSELHIYGVEFADEDVYRCYVGYTFETPDLNYAEAMLVVQSDPRPTCSFQDVVNAQSGNAVTLRCLVRRVKPAPTLMWDIEGREITPQPTTINTLSDDQYSYIVTTSITFVPVPEDDGKRVSIAMESPAWMGIRETSTSLNVTYKPIIAISPDPISLASGQDARISCRSQANPDLTTYTWILRQPNKPPKTDSSTGDTYHFKSIDMTYDKANLTCKAGNQVGDTDMTVQIQVTENGFTPRTTVAFSVAGGLGLLVLVLSSVLACRFRKSIIIWWSSKTGKNKDDKEFDVFISYKSGTRDEEFVVQEVIPRLEQDGYRVCVHYRFFLPGKSIIDNISDAVRRSRKTLLLLSPGFVESEWCRYEFQAALLQMLLRQMDIIPVIFEDLGPLENLSEDLQTVLRTLSYITWPDAVLNGHYPQREGDQEQFWKLLWKSLPETPLGLEQQVPSIFQGGDEDDVEQDVEETGDRVLMVTV